MNTDTKKSKLPSGLGGVIAGMAVIFAADAVFLLLFPQFFYYCAFVSAAALFVLLKDMIPYEIKPAPLKANAVCGFFSAVPLFYSMLSEFSAEHVNGAGYGKICFLAVIAAASAVNIAVYSRQDTGDGKKCSLSRSAELFVLDIIAFFIGIMAFIPAGALIIIIFPIIFNR